MSAFGEKLKALRGQYDLTQKELAESLGVTKGTVAKWEQGIRYPELSTMEKMAKAFKVPVGALIDEEDVGKKPAEIFAKRVRELRKQKGITQDDLADALCISKFSVSAWERGLRCPESSTVAMLADFFGVPERYFFSDIDELPVMDVEEFLSKKVAECLSEQFGTTECAGDYIISISIRKVNGEEKQNEEAGNRSGNVQQR